MIPDFIARHDRVASFGLANLPISDQELAASIGSEATIHPCRRVRLA
jgi:hypothetical protein